MINIRRMGCNGTHDTDFSIHRPNGYDCYLLLMVKTPAVFYLKNEEIHTEQDTLIVYKPNTPHHYKADHGVYINNWMQFDADEAWIEGMKLPTDYPLPIRQNKNLYTLFELIAEAFYSKQEHDELISFYLSNALLYSISSISEKSALPRHKEFVMIRRDIYSNPSYDWCIANISKKLNISQGYLQCQYKEAFGITCQQDVEKSRMEHACRLLSSTDMIVKQISYECGYQNSEHFMRRFKINLGLTPSEYRKMHTHNV